MNNFKIKYLVIVILLSGCMIQKPATKQKKMIRSEYGMVYPEQLKRIKKQ